MTEPFHSYPTARARAALWRFGTLPYVKRRFGGLDSPHLAYRPLFGHEICLDLARSDAHRLLYVEGERFVPERRLLESLLAPGMRVIDVGANIGYYMLFFAQAVGSQGRVVCFEPGPDNYLELARNHEHNRLATVEVRQEAIGAEAGEVRFDAALNGQVVADISDIRDNSGDSGDGRGRVVNVPQVTLDQLADRPTDLVKIDVDGYEGQVLEGAQVLLARHRPHVFLELHPWLLRPPHDAEAVLDLLRPHYPRFELYRPRRANGPFAKLSTRYLDPFAVRRLDPGDPEVAACLDGSLPEALWVVARRPGT